MHFNILDYKCMCIHINIRFTACVCVNKETGKKKNSRRVVSVSQTGQEAKTECDDKSKQRKQL